MSDPALPHPAPRARPSRLGQLHLLPWPFRLVLLAVLGASLLTLGLSEITVRAAVNDGIEVRQVMQRDAAANRFMTLLIDLETAQRGYLLLGEPAYLEPFQRAVRDIEPTSLELRRLVPPDSVLSKRLDRVTVLTTQLLGIVTATITLAGSGQQEAAVAMVRQGYGKRLMDDIRAEMIATQADSQRQLITLQARQEAATTRSRVALLVSTILAVILLMFVARLALDQAAAEETVRLQALRDADRMQEVIAARTADLAALSSHLQVVGEKEKADLARDLHDEMGGLLTAARMDLSWLQGAAGKDPEIGKKLKELSDVLAQAMDVKRRVVESLRPALLDHFGLPTALQHHFDETCRKAGLNCTTKIPETMADLPDNVAIALFRVGQESLTNVLRHARAKNVHLEITEDQSELRLEIRDDGSGMEVAEPGTYRSYGLAGMRHRIAALGGKFEVDSRVGAGTRIDIRIPASRLEAGPR